MLIPLLLSCAAKNPELADAGAASAEADHRGSRKSTAPTPPPPPEPLLPDLSGTAATRPELRAGSNLEMTTLTWTTIRFSIDADTAALRDIDAGRVAAIQRHLAADPHWMLHQRDGVLTAEQRVVVGDGFRLPASGYHEESARMWRVAIRFGAAAGDPWAEAGLISTAQAGDPTIRVEGIPLSGAQAGRLATAIAVEAPALAVDIFESGPSNDRSITAEALGTIPVVLPQIHAERVTALGYDPAWLSETAVRTGTPSAALAPLSPGFSEVTGWLSLTTPGWTWLRLLDADGQPVQDDIIPTWSAERVGWGEGLFYYQAVVPTPEPSPATTAQLWHLTDGAQAPVKLLEWAL
jgi:hypothetical protein